MDKTDVARQEISQIAYLPEVRVNTNKILMLLFGTVFLLMVAANQSNSEILQQNLPENSQSKKYGDGWECMSGYRAIGNACNKIIVPEHAYETNRSYGNGWECTHGFRQVDDIGCVEVTIPANGFLAPSGQNWGCLRGFKKLDGKCQKIILPENAYLNSSSYGQPWLCERGFFEKSGKCDAVFVPENAYLDDQSYSNDWRCERGYTASGIMCEFIIIPTNAHLDRSGNRWECDRSFHRSKGKCVLNN